MYIHIDATKQYFAPGEMFENPQAAAYYDRIKEVNHQVQKQLLHENQRRKILIEDLNSYLEDYVEHKYAVHSKYHKLPKEHHVPQRIVPMVHETLVLETEELKEDLTQLKQLFQRKKVKQ